MTGTQCRSCGAPIMWARTVKGKLIPLDFEPVTGGNIHLRDTEVANGRVVTYAHVEAAGTAQLFDDGEPAYVAHFTTCPDADRWRHQKGTP
jgi:hypothetical protein